MLLELVLALGLIFPGLLLIRLARFKFESNLESLTFSYVLSLSMIFAILYLGGIANSFSLASFLVLGIELTSFVYFFLLFLARIPRSLDKLRAVLISNSLGTRLAVLTMIAGLVAVYVGFLSLRIIYDSDVVETYLPLARQIASTGSLTYDNGYDYMIRLIPVGGSVLYAWTYVISGSTLVENFRLLPVVSVLMLVLINYQISLLVTKSKTLATISSIVLMVLPFNDRLLFYNAFYPDTYYYPLIFMTIYLLIKYSQTRNARSFFWAGLALGVAALLKAQTIYFLLAFLIAVAAIEFRSRIIRLIMCCLAPFVILVPLILAVSIQREGFRFFFPAIAPMQFGLLIFLSLFSGTCYLFVSKDPNMKTDLGANRLRGILKKAIMLLVPFALFSCIWYLNNLVRFGSILYTSSINLPNYSWALGVLNSIGSSPPIADMWSYLAYFMFVFVHPAVMGYVMLVPFLIGLYSVSKKRFENLGPFLLFEIVSTLIILSAVVFSISSYPGYNPRDILPLAPLLSLLVATGIYSVASGISKGRTNRTLFISLVITAYFGLLNYVHSVVIYYNSMRSESFFADLISSFAGIVGLDLEETSFQLSYVYQATFVASNLYRMLTLSFIAGLPLLALLAFWYHKSARKSPTKPMNGKNSISPASHLSRRMMIAGNIVLVCVIVSVVAYPRVGIPIGQINPQTIQNDQLKWYYGQAYGAFVTKYEGGVLTYGFLPGLAYYSPGTRVVDLTLAANLAALRDCFNNSAPDEAVAKLKNHNIRYILIVNSSQATIQLDALLNYTLSGITRNESLAPLIGVFGSWYLFDMGP